MTLAIDGNKLTSPHGTWDAGYPIRHAREADGRVYLILDYMAFPRWRQAQNLRAFTIEGHSLWTAQHPTNETADCYVDFVDKPGLVVSNFAGYECAIDPGSGKLVEARFTK